MVLRGGFSGLGRPGGDLLSRVLRRSTIGAEGFHGRVRDGIGCLAPRQDHQAEQGSGSGITEKIVFGAGLAAACDEFPRLSAGAPIADAIARGSSRSSD